MNLNPHKDHNLSKMDHRTVDREQQLLQIEREAVANFSGLLDELQAALGFLRFGDYYGWRVLVIVHNKRTIRKYEQILNINIKEFFPEEGSQSSRSIGLNLAKKIGNFWKVVSGDIKIDDRRLLSEKILTKGT